MKSWTQDEDDLLKSAFPAQTTSELVLLFQRSENAISARAARLGLTKSRDHIRTVRMKAGAPRRYECDHRYFQEITDSSRAYWLGFLWADGCVCLRNDYSDCAVVSLVCHRKDEVLLERFKLDIAASHPIFHYKNKLKSQLSITSGEMARDLMNLGVGPKKTWGDSVPNIPQHLVPHFVRGLFDGDGSLYLHGGDPILTIAGTKTTCYWLASTVGRGKVYPHCRSTVAHYWTVGGRRQVLSLGDWLYADAPFWLKRKCDKFQSLRPAV